MLERTRDDETADETLDRNWGELLQELRVAQTGVQLLSGFLLTLPFQQRFATLGSGARHLYLFAVVVSALATALLVAPVPLHRLLFRQHEREVMVRIAHWCALAGVSLLAVALVSVTGLVFDVVVGRSALTTVVAVLVGVVGSLWFLGPLVLRLRLRR